MKTSHALTMRSQRGVIEDRRIEARQGPDARETKNDLSRPAWTVAEMKKLDFDRLVGMIVLTSPDDIAGEVPYAHLHLSEMAPATHADFPDLMY